MNEMRSLTAREAATIPLLLFLFAVGVAECPAQVALTEHTLTRDGDHPVPQASIHEVEWLAGRWLGEGLGAVAEEAWLPPAGGAMAGVFRLVRDGEVELYEVVTLEEEGRSLTLRLKHFGRDLVGWEGKDEVVTFSLLKRDAETLWFDGLTIRRLEDDRMRIWVALAGEGEMPREALFEYRRVEPGPPLP